MPYNIKPWPHWPVSQTTFIGQINNGAFADDIVLCRSLIHHWWIETEPSVSVTSCWRNTAMKWRTKQRLRKSWVRRARTSKLCARSETWPGKKELKPLYRGTSYCGSTTRPDRYLHILSSLLFCNNSYELILNLNSKIKFYNCYRIL